MDARGIPTRRVVAVVALAVAALLPAATADAANVSVEHSAFQVAEVGPNPDGVRAPGDLLDLTETVLSADPRTIMGVSGTLSAPQGGVSVLSGAQPFDNLVFGQTSRNAAPWRVQIPTSADCGTRLRFSLHLDNGTDTADVPFSVPTGVPGTPFSKESVDVPHAVPNPGVLTSDLPIAQSGRVKDIRVRIGQLDHTYDEDVTIALIAPDGTKVTLVDRRGGAGNDFTNTVFAADGPSPVNAAAPFTGTFRAEGDLSQLDGAQIQGTWRLQVTDSVPSDSGLLKSWGLDVVPASCIAKPGAAFQASPQPALPGENVTLDASMSTDPAGTITSYRWDLDNNGTYETDGGASPTLVHQFPARGAYVVGLKITDDHGDSDTTTRSVSVTTPPTASFTLNPLQPLSRSDVTLDASGSQAPDAGGQIVRYEWDLDGNGTFEADNGLNAVKVAQFNAPGTVGVRLRVTDDTGATAVIVKNVTVDNRPPVADLKAPTPVVAGVPAILDATGSTDVDGSVDSYAFDLDGDGVYETNMGPTGTVQRTFLAPGTYTVGVEVHDNTGAITTKTISVPVTAAPTAALSASATSLRPRQTVTLDASGSADSDGTIAGYRFDLDGDGTYEKDNGTNPVASTSFTTLGLHTLRVRVTDNAGATAAASVVVNVVDIAPVPVLSVAPNPAYTGTPVILDAAASTDPDGTIARYEWDLDGNGGFERDTGTTPNITWSYPNPGTFTVKVRVTDNDGVSTTQSVALVVTTPPAPAPAPSGGGTGTGTGGTGTGAGGTGPGSTGGTGTGTGSTGGTGTGSTGGTGTGGGTAAGPKLSAGLIGQPMQKLKTVTKKGLTVGCVADRPVLCQLVAEIQGPDAKRLKLVKAKKGAKPASFQFGLTRIVGGKGAGGIARFKLPSKLKKALKKQKSLLVVVRGVAVDAKRQQVTLTRAVLLRR